MCRQDSPWSFYRVSTHYWSWQEEKLTCCYNIWAMFALFKCSSRENVLFSQKAYHFRSLIYGCLIENTQFEQLQPRSSPNLRLQVSSCGNLDVSSSSVRLTHLCLPDGLWIHQALAEMWDLASEPPERWRPEAEAQAKIRRRQRRWPHRGATRCSMNVLVASYVWIKQRDLPG